MSRIIARTCRRDSVSSFSLFSKGMCNGIEGSIDVLDSGMQRVQLFMKLHSLSSNLREDSGICSSILLNCFRQVEVICLLEKTTRSKNLTSEEPVIYTLLVHRRNKHTSGCGAAVPTYIIRHEGRTRATAPSNPAVSYPLLPMRPLVDLECRANTLAMATTQQPDQTSHSPELNKPGQRTFCQLQVAAQHHARP
jgi:hypothetical protein